MPSTRIETQSGWIEGRQRELIEAVQRALVQSIKIPEADRDIRLVEFAADFMVVPLGKSDRYISIEISMFPGRSEQAKRVLFSSLTEEMAKFGVNASDVNVVLHEVERKNWGLGGVSASDVALTYDTDV